MFQNGVKRINNCSRQWEAGVHCSDMFFVYNSKSGNWWHTAGLDSQSHWMFTQMSLARQSIIIYLKNNSLPMNVNSRERI